MDEVIVTKFKQLNNYKNVTYIPFLENLKVLKEADTLPKGHVDVRLNRILVVEVDDPDLLEALPQSVNPANPLFDARLFQGRNLRVALFVNFVVGAALVIAMVDVPLFINSVEVDLERAAVYAGWTLSALTAAMAITSYIGGRVTERWWYQPPVLLGLAMSTGPMISEGSVNFVSMYSKYSFPVSPRASVNFTTRSDLAVSSDRRQPSFTPRTSADARSRTGSMLRRSSSMRSCRPSSAAS